MKKIILVAGAATLAACTPNEGEEAETEEAVEETAMEEVAEGPGMAGTYTVYDAEGELAGTAEHRADGTFTFTDAVPEEGSDGITEGMWENRDGMMCADATEAEGEEDTGPRCWSKADAPDDQGRDVWTSDDEEPITAYTTFVAA